MKRVLTRDRSIIMLIPSPIQGSDHDGMRIDQLIISAWIARDRLCAQVQRSDAQALSRERPSCMVMWTWVYLDDVIWSLDSCKMTLMYIPA